MSTKNEYALARSVDLAAGEPLSLAHRPLIEPMLRSLDLPLSEYSFPNLYLHRDVHRYALVLHPVPHVLGTTYDNVRHAMPLLRIGKAEADVMLTHASCIYPVTEEVARLSAAFGLQSWWNDDDSDYTYDARRLASLEGSALRPKRTQAAAFAASASPSIETLGPDNRQHACDILESWMTQVNRPKGDTDYDVCVEALANVEALGLDGIVVYEGGGQPCAFLLAHALGRNGMALHFAKGNRDLPGVYPYMFSQFAVRCGASWLNFEQDLGKPGLRQAKRAFDPMNQLRKYRLQAAVSS
jgi:uncharacterized protein